MPTCVQWKIDKLDANEASMFSGAGGSQVANCSSFATCGTPDWPWGWERTCTFATGDGTLGTGATRTELATTTSKEACELHVKDNVGVTADGSFAANGVTWEIATNKCFALYGMTGIINNTEHMTCMLA